MKDIDQFTRDILQKVNARKKTRRIKNVTFTCVISFTLIFLIMYSNIIPITSFDILKYTYESYKGVYASQEENTIFSFANNSSAILSFNSVPYKLDAVNNTKKEFNFNATKIESASRATDLDATQYTAQENDDGSDKKEEYLDTTKIDVVFYEGGATITGNFYGITLSIDVVIVKNSTMESGVWKCFDKDNPNASSLDSYIVVNERGETYYIDDISKSYELLYISVYGNEYTVLLDNYGTPSEFITVDRLAQEEYGVTAIKLISHIGNEDRYFRLIDGEETIDFQGGEFTAKYVNAKKTVKYLGKNDMAKYLPIQWRLTAEQGHKTKMIDAWARINLTSDGGVDLRITESGKATDYQGQWVATDKYLIVVLEERSAFGKTFVIYNQNKEKSFSQNAKTNVTIRDGFKTGYHDFDYYLTTTYYTVYWGSEFTEDDAKNLLTYEQEYTLNGYYYKWAYDMSLPFSYETEVLPESGKVKIVIHENNTIDVIYEEGTVTISYVKEQLSGTDSYVIRLNTAILLKRDEDNNIRVKSLNLVDGELRAQYISYHSNFGTILNHYIVFTK